jgi:LDH2 family malate/lactate/ureidoglycolate dehydrogenase
MNQATLIRFPYETLEAFGLKLLATTPISEEEAATLIKVLLDTNLRGLDTHGINMLPFYVKRYKNIVVSYKGIIVTVTVVIICLEISRHVRHKRIF